MFRSGKPIVNQWHHFRLTAPRAVSRLLAATVFPPRCCLCSFEGSSLDLDLCDHCHADLPWSDFDGAELIPLHFDPPVDDLIRRLKYQGVMANARVLGVLLADAARQRATPLPKLLVPVPLHPARFRERGFNQAAAIALYASRMLGIPLARHAVRRVRDTPSQTKLGPGERRLNLRGAFALSNAYQQRRLLAAAHVAIVDDVVTTGSTANELRGLLSAAGVSQVEVWAVARAS
jgi:ComF family protein